jgi:catechol 2,3-dioxygenase-like lactoylglutathione lyase family enzyme
VTVNFLNAVLIVSEQPARLARWYRDVLGLPLEDEQHGGGAGAAHYGCSLRGLHFAIHPTATYAFAPETGTGAVRLAFNVSDIDVFETTLKGQDLDWVFRPVDLGWSRMLALRDPDGNYVEVVQMKARRETGE